MDGLIYNSVCDRVCLRGRDSAHHSRFNYSLLTFRNLPIPPSRGIVNRGTPLRVWLECRCLRLWCMVLKPGAVFQESELQRTYRAVSLFGHMNLCNPPVGIVWFRVVHLIAIDEDNHIGVLFDRTRLTKVGENRSPVASIFHLAVELGKGDNGDV